MTLAEFSVIMADLEAGYGKCLQKESVKIYFDLLGDLPFEVLSLAAKRVLLEHKWHTFPSIAELRQAASDVSQGVLSRLSPGEAWKAVYDAIKRMDPSINGSVAFHCSKLPALVLEAFLGAGGASVFIGSGGRIDYLRGQFIKVYEEMAAREARVALLPAALKEKIEQRRLPAEAAKVSEQQREVRRLSIFQKEE